MKVLATSAMLSAMLLASAAHAQRGTVMQAKTAGELAELCAANPKDPLGDDKINFCLGYAQGAVEAVIRHGDNKKLFCFPKPEPKRIATMSEFVGWVRSMPDHRTPAAVDGLFQFLGERFPCK